MPCRHGLFFVCRSDRTTALTEFPFRAASMESDERLDRRLGQTGGRRYWHPVNARLVICEANVPLGTAGPALSVDGTQSGVPALPLTKALPSTM